MSIESEAEKLIDPILAAFRAKLYTSLLGHTFKIYVQGYAQMSRYAGLPFEGPPMLQAIEYAQKHCAKLVKEIDDETKTRLAKVISDGIRDKKGIPGLAADIRGEFKSEIADRAELIARTETNTALSDGSFRRMKNMGVTGKQWHTVGDDRVRPEHKANEDVGVIPIDEPFPDGSMKPPGRNPFFCRCVLIPIMLPE